MAPSKALLDTDTLSAATKRHPAVLAKVDDYLAVHGVLSFSIITRYEVLRGLKAKNATTQIATFERVCAESEIVPLTDEIVVKAADVSPRACRAAVSGPIADPASGEAQPGSSQRGSRRSGARSLEQPVLRIPVANACVEGRALDEAHVSGARIDPQLMRHAVGLEDGGEPLIGAERVGRIRVAVV